MANDKRSEQSTAKAKLKATNDQDRIHLWKQHFENLSIEFMKLFAQETYRQQ